MLKVFLGKTELSRHLDATQLGLLGHAPIATRSPSRHKVAYAVAYPDHTAELVTADLATGAYTTTTRNGTGTAPLTWNPEGDRLVVAVATHTTESLPQGGTLSGWHPHKLTVLVTRDSFLPSTDGQWSAPTPAHHELLAHIPVPGGTQVIALEGKVGGHWFHLPFASVVAPPSSR